MKYALILLLSSFGFAQNTHGAYVATLGSFSGTATDFTVGQTVGTQWVLPTPGKQFDVIGAVDMAPGGANSWTYAVEFATGVSGVPLADACANLATGAWIATPSGALSGTSKAITGSGISVPSGVGSPACMHVHFKLVAGSARTNLGGGTIAVFFDSGAPALVASQSACTGVNGTLFIGNVCRDTNDNRAYWILPGVTGLAVSGTVVLRTAPGAGVQHLSLAYSTASLGSGDNCAGKPTTLSGDLATGTGTVKVINFASTLSTPQSGCYQLRVMCTPTASACGVQPTGPDATLLVSTAENASVFSSAGSYKQFVAGSWGISDTQGLGQDFQMSPSTGLSQIGLAFNFDTAMTGQFDFGVRYTPTLTQTQGCKDPPVTDIPVSMSITGGSKGNVSALIPITIPPGACWTTYAKVNGSGSDSGQSNWMAVGIPTVPVIVAPPTPSSFTAAASQGDGTSCTGQKHPGIALGLDFNCTGPAGIYSVFQAGSGTSAGFEAGFSDVSCQLFGNPTASAVSAGIFGSVPAHAIAYSCAVQIRTGGAVTGNAVLLPGVIQYP